MSSIGQIPNLPDRQHRQFLARLKESVEEVAKRPTAPDYSAAIAALRAELLAMIATSKTVVSQPDQIVSDSKSMVLLGDAVNIWSVVAQTVDGAVTASNDIVDHANCVVGIAAASGVSDDLIPVAVAGDVIENDDWNWAPGAVLWLGLDGALVDPTAYEYVPPVDAPMFEQPVAIALTATRIFVLLGLPVLEGDGGSILSLNEAGFAQRTNIRVKALLAEDVPAFSVVAQTATGAVAADNTTTAHADFVFGITTEDGVTGDEVLVAQSGSLLTNDAWTWTVGALLWLDEAGQMTETLPTADLVQPVAIAMDTDTVFVFIGLPVLTADGGDFLGLDENGRVQRIAARATVVTSLPTAGDEGRLVTYDRSLWFDNGQIFVRSGPKVGKVEMLAHSTPDAGWYLCNGAAKSRTGFPELFAAIGTTYGAGDGSTTFNLPNLTDRFAMGNTPGASGGANTDDLTHTHDTSSLAISSAGSHSHSEGSAGSHSHSAGYNGGHNHGGATGYESNGSAVATAGSDLNLSGAPHYHTISTESDHTHSIGSAGSHTHTIDADGTHTHTISGALDDSLTDPHDNRPAYTGFAFYIFAGR